VITGANGAVGTSLIEYLGEVLPTGPTRLRGLVRSLERAQSLSALAVEVIKVDYHHMDSLRGAVVGADTVVHLAGALLTHPGETLVEANAETTRAVVEAATTAGVKTFVYLSFPGANPASKNRYLSSKGMAEEIIQGSGFSGVIFRVPMILGPGSSSLVKLHQMALAPLVPLLGGGSVRIQPVSQANVLAAIKWAISFATQPLRVMDLVGPETLTYAELLRRVGQRLGRRPRVFRVPKAAGWLSALLAGGLVPSLGWNRSVFDILFNEHLADPSHTQAVLPFALTTVNEALDQAVPPQVEKL
jgi:NADH dehydrogenase